jgi:hypothetical protein
MPPIAQILAVKDKKRLKKYQQVVHNHGPTRLPFSRMVSRAMICNEPTI